jgi:hypothetical protein
MPLPGGPAWMILLPIASSSGRTRSRSSGSAPTMNRHSPRPAWAGERPTPASTKRTSRSARRAAMARLASSDRAGVEVQQSRPAARQHAVRPQHGGLHVGRVGQHGHDDVAGGDQRRQVDGDGGPGRDRPLRARRHPVEHRHRVALGRQVGRHRPAHVAETDEPDSFRARRHARAPASNCRGAEAMQGPPVAQSAPSSRRPVAGYLLGSAVGPLIAFGRGEAPPGSGAGFQEGKDQHRWMSSCVRA